ncbi:MAG: RNA-binding protein [Candidatus Eremiobacteraeota bacterium]|nr:RNA-binding protein [Candidatus Eremiobacteraeota bacterium]
MNLYVGNLSYKLTENELREAFEDFGSVVSVRMINDRETGRPRGFGFVEMADRDEAQNAIDSLNGQEVGGRKLVVNEARPKASRY